MALSVAKPTAQPKITVGVPFKLNGSLQGSTVNPQPTYNPQPATYNPQPATYNPQRTYNPQPAAAVMPTSVQVAAAAEQVRQAQAVEVARQKEATRVQVQGQIDNKVAANTQAINLKVSNPAWQGKVSLGKRYKLPKIVLPEQTAYDKAYADAYNKAMGDVQGKTKIGHQNIAQKGWDKLSFGADRRASGARDYAVGQATKVVDQTTNAYKKNLTGFLSTQAQKKAAVEGAKFLTQAEFDKAAAEYTAWESAEIQKLDNQRAHANAQIDAYGKASSAPLTSAAAKGASMFNRNVVHGAPGKLLGGVWNYTLGQGSQNVPSLVTLPSRIVNTVGNLNTQGRTIYQEGGTSINRTGSNLNAWQASQNQRSFNLKPWIDKKYDANAAEKMFGKQIDQNIAQAKSLSGKKIGWTGTTGGGKVADPQTLTRDYWRKQLWAGYNQEHRLNNSILDTAADPINLAGGVGKIGKATKLGDKVLAPIKASKFGSWIGKTTQKVADNKAIQWLGAEHKTPEQHLQDAIDEANNAQKGAQSILPRVNMLNKKLAAAGGAALDTSVFSDLGGLSESEAKVLQRMTAGKLTTRDRVLLAGKNYEPVRQKLEGIATKWQDFSEQMRVADNVETTRFGLGKRTYSPSTAWISKAEGNRLDKYNFRLFKKNLKPQSKDNFYQGAVDRYFKSNIDNNFAKDTMGQSARIKAERDALLQRYDQATVPQRAAVEKAYAKTRTPFNRSRAALRKVSPMTLWKKSVLKYRPAWTVNNVLYNTQAAALAGGGKALVEQAKMVNPRYWRKAMDESRAAFGGNLSKEIGKGKLNRFYTGVEDWSRVAAGRAAMKNGHTQEQALKRVNRYLFDYKTRNWERPIKAVVPFWQFQKNLAKAAAVMPFDRPLAAKGYNKVDQYQQQQYNNDFNSMIPELKKLGYNDAEIEKFRQDNAKYYAGRLKVGGKYITTPFNAFSEKQMSQLGFNPFAAAAGETADSVDSYGKTVKGSDASWKNRLTSKFPQVDLGKQALGALAVQKGRGGAWGKVATKLPINQASPHSSWIAQPGSEGYGMTKEKQSYDPSKPNYVKSGDPRAKLGQNALAFVGVPKSLAFDKKQFIKSKTLQKATAEYFSKDWKNMPYPDEQKQQAALFKKYGLTADDFYKGILAKYDTEQTKNIKNEKQAAAAANKSLFDEYGRQPKGTRNLWATKKLKELVAQGYFDKNPFLKSFKWVTPTSVAKADKQQLVTDAVRSGDWSKYQAKYGKTQKQKDYELASKSGDWSAWGKKYGFKSGKAAAYNKAKLTNSWADYTKQFGDSRKTTPFQHAGKFFKTADSMQKYKDGEFWRQYAIADRSGKKQLLADHPEYNTRGNWTAAMWTAAKNADKAQLKGQLATVSGFNSKLAANTAAANKKSTIFLAATAKTYRKKLKYA